MTWPAPLSPKVHWIETDSEDGKFYPYQVRLKSAEVCRLIGRWQEAESALRGNLRATLGPLGGNLAGEAKQRLATILMLLGRYDEAEAMSNEALEIHRSGGDEAGQIHCWINIGNIHKRRSRFAEAGEALGRAASLAEGTGRHDLRIVAYGNIGVLHLGLSQYQQAVECFDRVHRLAVESGDERQVVNSMMNIGQIDLRMGNLARASLHFDETMGHARKIGDRQAEAIVNMHLSDLHGIQGDGQSALAHSLAALEIFEILGDRLNIIQAYNNVGLAHYNLGEYDKAEEFYHRHYRGAVEQGNRIETGMALGNLSNINRDRGRFPEAMEFCLRARDIFESAGHRHACCIVLDNLGTLQRLAGRADEAGVSYERAIGIAREMNLRYNLSSFLHNMAQLQLERGEGQKAEADNREALALAEEVGRADVKFKAGLMAARLAWPRDGECAAAALRELADKAEGAERAEALYHLARLGGDEGAREQAVSLYSALYQRTPKHEFRSRIGELSGRGTGSGGSVTP